MPTVHPERRRDSGRARMATTLGLLLLAGCADTAVPLHLEAVSPTRSAEGLVVELQLSGAGIRAAVLTDFRSTRQSRLDATVSATLVAADARELPLEDVVFIDTSLVRAKVPLTTPRGLYDVRLTDAQGATDTLAGAFSIVAPAEAVARFEFQPLGAQHAKVPFAVRALAVDEAGALVESFDGMLELTDDTGTVAPARVGPFVRGQLQVFVSITVLAANTVLHGRNLAGKTGDSSSFTVTAGPATSVVFALAPPSAAAGGCSGPFELRLEDSQGFPTTTPADLAVALAAIPALGVEFFSDVACTASATGLTIATGGASAKVYVKATVAGALAVRAAPNSLPSVQATVVVRPQAPTRLTFATAPATVMRGACSPSFDVRAEDAWGNASAPPAALPLRISATPAAGVAFFDDDTCTRPASAPRLDVGMAQLRFFVQSTIAATVHLDVSAAGLADAGADLEVTP